MSYQPVNTPANPDALVDKPVRVALGHIVAEIAQLDEITQQLEKRLQDILQPPNPTPAEEEKDEKEQTSIITNTIRLNTKAISAIVIRIEQILARLEI